MLYPTKARLMLHRIVLEKCLANSCWNFALAHNVKRIARIIAQRIEIGLCAGLGLPRRLGLIAIFLNATNFHVAS